MSEPIRVLRVIARLNMGGPAIHVSNLAAGLETRGYHTTLVAGSLARGEDSMAYVAERLGVSVVSMPEMQREVAPLHDAKSIRRLTAIMREERPHILHTHTAKAGALARAAALVAGKARPPIVVHTFHGHVLKGYFGPGRTAFFRQVERNLARSSDVLVAVSPEVRDELVAHGIAPTEKFTVIRLGIPLEERLGDETADLDYRHLYGIPADAFVVGWVGRMTGVKDTGAVLEIVRAARERGIDAVLCMVGDGPDRERLEQLAHDLGIARSTYFVGYQEDVAGYYRLFDAFLLPSVNEGTPVSAIEALASGTPVVATRVGGVPDVVRDGIDGFLVEPGDTDAAAERLAELALDPDLRARLGESGRAYARDALLGRSTRRRCRPALPHAARGEGHRHAFGRRERTGDVDALERAEEAGKVSGESSGVAAPADGRILPREPLIHSPAPWIALARATLRKRDGHAHGEKRRELRKPLELPLEPGDRPVNAWKPHDHVVAEPVQRVVRPARGDALEGQLRPFGKLLCEQPPHERDVGQHLVRVHSHRVVGARSPGASRPSRRGTSRGRARAVSSGGSRGRHGAIDSRRTRRRARCAPPRAALPGRAPAPTR